METFADLRHAVRVLAKSPGFTIVAVAALALGIGANTAIFSVVNSVLLKPLPYAESERIMRLGRSFNSGMSGAGNPTSIPKFMSWKQTQTFEAMAAYDFSGPGMNLGSTDRPQQVKAIHVSQDFFRVFGTSPIAGRTFTAEEDRPGGQRVAVVGYGLWKARFGGALSLIGAPVNLNGDAYTVVGILPANFQSDPQAEIFIPLQADPNSANHGNYLRVSGRLKPGATVAGANAQLKVIAEQFRRANPKWMDKSEGIRAVLEQEAAVEDVRPALLILLGAVGLVLLIACANVANLLLARAAGRQKEIAIRSAIGASRWRIVRQLLTESVVLACLGGVLGFVLGAVGVRALTALIPPNIPRLSDVDGVAASIAVLDWRVLAFTLGVAFLTGIVFGLFPALQIARTNVNSVLKETSGRSGTGLRQNRLRGMLVISETALALVLLIGAALLIQTFIGLKNVNPGFDAHNVLTMKSSLAGERYTTTAQVDNLARQAIQRIEALPGVQAAALTVMPPGEGSVDLPFIIEGRPPDKGEMFNGDENWGFITPHYFDTFRIRLLRGRVFNDGDGGGSSKVVIINEAMAKKYWPKDDPIGRRISIGGKALGPEFDDPPRQIVGIVASVRQADISRPARPMMYVPQTQVSNALNAFAIKVIPLVWTVRTAVEPLSLSTAVQREIASVDGQMAVTKIRSMEQVLGETIARQNFNMLLLSVFAGIALLLAAIGIYGLMSYAVEQRTQEMGIRMALGARPSEMVRMVVFQGMKLALAGVVLGLGAAFGLTRLLSALLYGVKASDALTFSSVAAILTAVALLATYIPARRATKVDPLEALRYE